MYSPQQAPFTGPSYQQPVPPNMPYINSQASVSQPELPIPAGVDPQGAFLTESSNANGFDPFGFGPWTDWSKSPDGHRSLGSLPPPTFSPQSLTTMGSFAHNFSPLAAGMVNANPHFCEVAEMMGPVDFDQIVDYWQQDKWSGQFPVRWHIIKDVPNSQFQQTCDQQ